MGRRLIQLIAISEKRQRQRLRSSILALSVLILAISPSLVKAEQPQVNVIVSENSQPATDEPLSPENNDLTTDPPSEQINDVSKLTDVTSQDWAYEALRNLVKHYNCVYSYPDKTLKGDRTISRYEFARNLQICLDKIQELNTASNGDSVKKDDLTTIEKLKNEFSTELSILHQRINKLDDRITALEKGQFSTSALLGGEVIFAPAQAFGGGPPGTGQSQPVFNYLARLQLVSSFTGKDRLRVELSTDNFSGLGFAAPNVLNTYTSLLSYQGGYNSSLQLSNLEYRFAGLGNRAVFTIKPVGFTLSSVLSPNSPYFDLGRGAISRFAEVNPIFQIGALDSGVGIDYLLNKRTRLQIAYGARTGNDPELGAVLGKGAYATGIQLLYLPGNDVITGFTYVYSFSPDGRLDTFTGSAIADASGFINQPADIHALGATLRWRITPKLTFATWGGVTATYADLTNAVAVSSNYIFSLGLSDPFGRKGDVLAVLFGQEPTLINVGQYVAANGGLLANASSYHIETFYNLNVNDHISITPGFFLVTHPGNIEDNNTIYVGVLRTTFRF